jgi:porin
MKDDRHNISSLSGLIYTSIFVNPTLLGVIGGYEDSVFGVTTNIAPTKNSWVTLGSYDGNKARGFPSGLHNPHLSDGYIFNIAEAGMSWFAGEQQHPGQFGIGIWYQTGKFDRPGIYGKLQNTGEGGLYLYGGQRVWSGDTVNSYSHDDTTQNTGNGFQTKKVPSISIFYQYGVNNSKSMLIRQFTGVGFTAFSMIDGRPDDSFGAGMGLSFLNQNLFQRASELMFQTYYQASIVPDAIYVQPTLSYIPTPGQIPSNLNYTPAPGMAPNLPPALAGTLRLTMIF